MRLLLGFDNATGEFLDSLRSRFAPDCPYHSSDGDMFIILDSLPLKHAERYPSTIRKIAKRQVAFPLGRVAMFEQREIYQNGRYKPPGVALQTYLTPEIWRIRSEMLQALQGLPGTEMVQSRERLSCPFSRPQTIAEARETAEALKAAFPKGISLGLVNRLILLEGVENKFESAYRSDFYFKGSKKYVKYE
jgi:hypothetical protein